MQFETIKDKKLKEDLDRMFGHRETAKDMRQAVFMARKGLVNDEAIAAYVKYKEEERKAYLEVMTEENPDYAFKTGVDLYNSICKEYGKDAERIFRGEDLLSLDNVKESNENDVVPEPELRCSTTAECRDREYGGDQDALPEH